MKLIGIDYGKRRIGLAATDENGTVVRGLPTIDKKKHRDPVSALLSIFGSEKPAAIVIGLPLDADDRDTQMSTEIRKFAADLEKRASLPLYFIDESLTSKQAASLMRFRKKKERRDNGSVDRLAACLILEAFLREKYSEMQVL